MRTVVVAAASALLACTAAGVAHADPPPAPAARWTPPDGYLFDDAIAVAPDGKRVAALVTDLATTSTLHVYDVGGAPLTAKGLPPSARAIHFLTPDRVLVVVQREGATDAFGLLASVRNGKLSMDSKRLGPAGAIDVVDRDGKRYVVEYRKLGGKKGAEHEVQISLADGLRPVARRRFAETAEGALRTRAGEARLLWWSRGHTQLVVQKIGEYDRARDIRRPDRFVRLDLLADKIVEEHEIEDVMAFAKVSIVRKTAPSEEAFARLSEDHHDVLLLDGLDEKALPLARPMAVYDPESLRSQILDEATLLVGFQVDPNNFIAVSKRVQDPDDFDLYAVDRASIHGKAVSARRVLTLPGGGRHTGFSALGHQVAVLRKGKGFDRGGVAIELYALP